MKATESMKSYWKQALVAVLVMGGLVAVTATPARALSLWGPTKADGSPVTGFVMPGTYTNEDPEALTGNASVCAMGPFEARDANGPVTLEYRVTRIRPDQAVPDLFLAVLLPLTRDLRNLVTRVRTPYQERTYVIRGVTQISPVYFQIIVKDGFQTLTSKAYELWITTPGTGADTRGCQSVSANTETMAKVAEGPLEVTSAKPVGLTTNAEHQFVYEDDRFTYEDHQFIYEWDERFLHNQRFPTAKPFNIRFSFSAPVAVTATRMRHDVLSVSGGSITGINPGETMTNWTVSIQPDRPSLSSPRPVVSFGIPSLNHRQGLEPYGNCSDIDAICTDDGRKLVNGKHISIAPPPYPRTIEPFDLFAVEKQLVDHNAEEFTFSVIFTDAIDRLDNKVGEEATSENNSIDFVFWDQWLSFGPSDRPGHLRSATLATENWDGRGWTKWKFTGIFGRNVTTNLTIGGTGACGTTRAICAKKVHPDDPDRQLHGSRSYQFRCECNGEILADLDGDPDTPARAEVAPNGLTAQLQNVPIDHDGSTWVTMALTFSEHVEGLGYRTLKKRAFTVTGGKIKKAKRVTKGNNQAWTLHVQPLGTGAITLLLPATTDCAAKGAICNGTDPLVNSVAAMIPFRQVVVPRLSVADAEVQEAAHATLDFVVTLDEPTSETVKVGYATRPGSATADVDYTSKNGRLVFAPQELTKTVSVAILDDLHDEGSETLTLDLFFASGATIDDGVGTGTINNEDPLQRAWLSRFGRSVGTHIVDAVGDRLRDTQRESYLTVAGQNIPLGKGQGEPTGFAQVVAHPLTNLDAGVTGDPFRSDGQAMNLNDILRGTSFRLKMGPDGAAGTGLTAWGRFAGTTFEGQDGDLSLDGDVFTGMAGVDATFGRVLIGAAMSHSRGDGSYGQGTLENNLTSLNPYVQFALTERLSVWGMAGYGWGDLDLRMDSGETHHTDVAFTMGAVGGRGVLMQSPGGFELATRSDFMMTNTESDGITGEDGNLAEAEGAAHRLRVVLEGTQPIHLAEGRSLTPTFELGLRHDFGDAETGFGLEVGGRIAYADPALGLTVEGTIRGLVAHEDEGYDEWGASANIRVAPGLNGHGLSVSLQPTWGVAQSGVQGLWSRQATAGLASTATGPQTGRVSTEVGYGFPVLSAGLLTPYAGTVLTDGPNRTYRVGTRLRLDGGWAQGLELSLEGARQVSSGVQPVNQGIHLQAGWAF